MIKMKKIEWSQKEESTIINSLDGLCADINNNIDDEVSVKYYHHNLEYEVCPDWNDPTKLHYIITKLYRNSKGDIIDDELIKHEIHPRVIGNLKKLVKKMVSEIRN
jgi:hypothetical protein